MRNILTICDGENKLGYLQRTRGPNGHALWQAYLANWTKVGLPCHTQDQAKAVLTHTLLEEPPPVGINQIDLFKSKV